METLVAVLALEFAESSCPLVWVLLASVTLVFRAAPLCKELAAKSTRPVTTHGEARHSSTWSAARSFRYKHDRSCLLLSHHLLTNYERTPRQIPSHLCPHHTNVKGRRA